MIFAHCVMYTPSSLFLIGINFGKVFPELFDYYSKNQDQLEGLYEWFSRGKDFTPWLLITEIHH